MIIIVRKKIYYLYIKKNAVLRTTEVTKLTRNLLVFCLYLLAKRTKNLFALRTDLSHFQQ